MVTSVNSDCKWILGHEYGADDYITKPFSHRVLLARANAVLRRAYPEANSIKVYKFADWQLNTVTRELTGVAGEHIKLTTRLYELLSVFLESPQRILTRDQLLDVTQGRPGEPFDRSIDIQLSRLCSKLNDNGKNACLIKTIRNEGYGYMLSVPVEKITESSPE